MTTDLASYCQNRPRWPACKPPEHWSIAVDTAPRNGYAVSRIRIRCHLCDRVWGDDDDRSGRGLAQPGLAL